MSLWVPLCCEKCEREVRESLEDMEGKLVIYAESSRFMCSPVFLILYCMPSESVRFLYMGEPAV